MKNILIADDHSIVRLGASVIISDLMKNATIVQAQTYEEVYSYVRNQVFDLLLLDINMPGGNNIHVIRQILELQPNLKILVFSSYEEHLYALRYIQAGAAGYLNKNTGMEELRSAVQSIQERGRYMSETVRDQYIEKLVTTKSQRDKSNPLYSLSNREMDVAKHLIDGMGILEVSQALGLSSSTVSTYKSRVFEKLGVSNIAELIELFKLHQE